MKKTLLLLIIILLVTGCSKNNNTKKDNDFKAGYATNLMNENDRESIKKIMLNNNLSNVNTFFDLLNEFNKEDDQGCGIKDWTEISNLNYNEANCTSRYEKNHDISDGNCRITAFTLIQDLLEIKNTKNDYSYALMFDINVIENNPNYVYIQNNIDKFITLFDEISSEYCPTCDIAKMEEWYPLHYKKHEIKINSDSVSLITVVLHENYDSIDTLFVGHTGILIKENDKYYFIEKIAFEQPYQISVFNDINELKNNLLSREIFKGDGTTKGPFIYQNDILI